jgi:MFS transporter, putative metabolite:H+ symporter
MRNLRIPMPQTRAVHLSIIVAALGYFVDIYDLILFSIVRVKSLIAIGVAKEDLLQTGALLLNMQMGGMLLGGILWGVLGDRRGRLSVLFGSIFLYSAANIANAFVDSVGSYAMLRLVAGIGLAGELGAGITLVSEIMPRETRGYGTTIVAAVGITGAVVAALVGDLFDWRTAYVVGGVMGFALLILRIGVYESGMFQQVKASAVRRGAFFSLFSNRERAIRYLSVILIGVPIWYVVGILVTFSPEFGAAMGMSSPPNAGRAVMFTYMGLAAGDLASGWLSQIIGSRKRVVLIFLGLTALAVAVYFMPGLKSLPFFYALCGVLGFATGYWAVFVTIASEQFGTNIRATATTTVPNFVRGAVVPLTLTFQWLAGSVGIEWSGIIVGTIAILLAFLALNGLEETYGKDLDYVDH